MIFFNKKELVYFLLVISIAFVIILFFENCYSNCYINNYNNSNNFGLAEENFKVFFCPEDFCSSRIISEIDKAEESVFVAIYSFTHEGIANSLISAKNKGIKVVVVKDFLQSTSRHSVVSLLEENNVPVFIKKGSGAMHNKFLIIDNKKVFTGSFNYSLNADFRNDENLVFIFDEKIALRFVEKFDELVRNAS
jgi:phosphatidylserine/phosphatidylglycerophosphate/cardiolipin synthase-like enzyme